MCANPINQVYIADGFVDDVEELIYRCLQRQDIIDFQSFCIVWKEMDLGCMYKGRTSGTEVVELSEEVLHVAKHYMLANTSNYEESVVGLFLVYSLLNLRPYPGFGALRLVPEDVVAISRLETVARRDKRHDVLYILASVLIKGPCHFHAAERERGMEASIRKYLDGFGSIDSIRGIRPKGVFFRQNEALDIIRELGTLTKRYTEAKEAVVGPSSSDKNLQYILEDMPQELNNSLRKVINGFIDEDDDDNVSDEGESQSTDDHHNLVESIKSRAMKSAVNPMKHLMGVEDRKRLAKNNEQVPTKSDIKSKGGKLKTSSSMKLLNSPIKRGTSPEGNISKKPKENPKSEELITEQTSSGEAISEFQVDIYSDDMEDQSEEEVIVKDADGNPMNVEIGYLPSFIRKDDSGQIIQIEIIDEDPKKTTKVDVIQLNSLPDLDSIEPNQTIDNVDLVPSSYECSTSTASTQQSSYECSTSTSTPSVDNEEYNLTEDGNKPSKNRDQRNLKKTHLKSKLKRLGMLPVANFEDT